MISGVPLYQCVSCCGTCELREAVLKPIVVFESYARATVYVSEVPFVCLCIVVVISLTLSLMAGEHAAHVKGVHVYADEV